MRAQCGHAHVRRGRTHVHNESTSPPCQYGRERAVHRERAKVVGLHLVERSLRCRATRASNGYG